MDTTLGILLVAGGAVVAIKAARTVLKLAFLALAVVGLYLWLGA